MPLNEAGANAVLDSGLGVVDTMSLHTGNPGADGTANEVSGAPYARQPVTWGPASGRQKDLAQRVVFKIPPGNIVITAYGFWKGGTFCGTADNPDPVKQQFTDGGRLEVASAPVNLPAQQA